MTKKQRKKLHPSRCVRKARRIRDWLKEQLGCKCAKCSNLFELEMDCIIPMGHEHHRKGFYRRMIFYRRQFRAGNLQLLCPDCHTEKTNNFDMHWESKETISETGETLF
jgi:5-methylcytosine-specific restriction endonuclease McrA